MNRRPWLAYAALASVCFFWGTTYLGIRMALESLSPAWLVAIRYTLSGAILTGMALARGSKFPRGKGLWAAAGCGEEVALGMKLEWRSDKEKREGRLAVERA